MLNGCGATRPSKYYQLTVTSEKTSAVDTPPYNVTLLLGPISTSQVRFVRFLCGIASPAIVLSQFALNKVIAHFRNSHREMASLKSIRIDFS
jgi:hypothetical protein